MDTRELGHLYTDCLVIGGGVAGMRAAMSAAKSGKVIMLCKNDFRRSNTFYAQGGIAAVLGPEDSIESHIQDTLTAGNGLCDQEVVRFVVENGPEQIEQLLAWNTELDKKEDLLVLGREGGHSYNRIVHGMGDATGRVLVDAIKQQVKDHSNIKLFDECFSIDFLTEGNQCFGVVCFHPRHGLQCIWARKTILATGGAGRLYRETTNPSGATADGLAMAYRAGAVLTDMEFVQFHPTTLYVAGATRVLITEAIRGEGGQLLDRHGHRFMKDYDERLELAPRDIVSRAIYKQMDLTKSTHVYLDVRHLGREKFSKRFPNISKICESFDIDVEEDLIPVRPSAHYMIGGVKTNLEGETSIKDLYACGEAAATGLHGSNRLASNSLLEGMVFGQQCGDSAAAEISDSDDEIQRHRIISQIEQSQRTELDISDVVNSLRSVMTRNVGVERHGDRLKETIEIIEFWQRYVLDKVFDDPTGWECQNMLTISYLIAVGSLQRCESRGVHYRQDYPDPRDDENLKHFDQYLEKRKN